MTLRYPNLTLRVYRKRLVDNEACADGLALYDAIADGAKSIKMRWTPLAQVWLAVGAPAFAGWLRDCGIVPSANLSRANLPRADLYGANLSGANLYGAYRYADDAPIPGWTRMADGTLTAAGGGSGR